MRLIDADELIKNLIHVSPECDEFGRGVATGISTAILEIYNLPFLALDDMRPKGRWIAQDETRTKFMCSVCESKNYGGHEKFCPNCGAKMDGGDKNDE